jgi:tol-pal system protein YbgF
MKFVRLAFLLCLCASFSFGASKEIVELQRDVAILQDQVRQVQRTLDEKMAQLTLLMQQTQDNSSKASSSVANIQSSVGQSVGQQLQPVLGLGNKVDSLTDNVRGLQSSIGDLNSRLSQLDAKVTDLGNKITLSQNPPAAPGATGAAAPPPGMTAESAWTNAERDRLGGNSDLALKEYQDYLTYFPNTDYAPSAQFYVGQIYYNRGDYDNALKALSAVEERYPDNPKTRSAMYLKGQTLVKTGDRQGAVQEFRQIMSKYPGTEEARRSSQQLKALGVSASAKPSPARRR